MLKQFMNTTFSRPCQFWDFWRKPELSDYTDYSRLHRFLCSQYISYRCNRIV